MAIIYCEYTLYIKGDILKMLQWGFPQFYSQTFMQMPTFNMFSFPAVNPFAPSFRSIFSTPLMFPTFNCCPVFTPLSNYNMKNQSFKPDSLRRSPVNAMMVVTENEMIREDGI